MRNIFIFLGMILCVSIFLTGCDNESNAQNMEEQELDLLRINTDLSLIKLYAPEDSNHILCNQSFALCRAAFCEVEPVGEVETCTCPVLSGTAIEDADAISMFQSEGQSGCNGPDSPFDIWSFFQPVEELPQAPDFIGTEPALGLACPQGDFANCFGYPCEWDGQSMLATCTCEIQNDAFGTAAGNCDINNCDNNEFGIPSGALITNPPFIAPT